MVFLSSNSKLCGSYIAQIIIKFQLKRSSSRAHILTVIYLTPTIIIVCYNLFIHTGAVYYYITWQLALFWFFHIVSIFFEIRLPFQTRSVRASGRIKYIHSGLLLIAVLFPLIPVMILIFVGGFSSRRFPPFICSPGNANAAFYSTFFPLSLVIASGSSLMIGIVWIIVKVLRRHPWIWS